MSGPPSFKEGVTSHDGYETPSAGCSTTTDTPATLHGTPGSTVAALDSFQHYRNPSNDHLLFTSLGLGAFPCVATPGCDGSGHHHHHDALQPPVPPSATSFLALVGTTSNGSPSSGFAPPATGPTAASAPHAVQRRFNPAAAPFVPASVQATAPSPPSSFLVSTSTSPPKLGNPTTSTSYTNASSSGGLTLSEAGGSTSSLYVELRGPPTIAGFATPQQWSEELTRWADINSDVALDVTTHGSCGRTCSVTIRLAQSSSGIGTTSGSPVAAASVLLLRKSGSNIQSALFPGPMTVVVERLVWLRLSGWAIQPTRSAGARDDDAVRALADGIAQHFAVLSGITFLRCCSDTVPGYEMHSPSLDGNGNDLLPRAVFLQVRESDRVFACEWSRCFSLGPDHRSLVPGTDVVVEVVS